MWVGGWGAVGACEMWFQTRMHMLRSTHQSSCCRAPPLCKHPPRELAPCPPTTLCLQTAPPKQRPQPTQHGQPPHHRPACLTPNNICPPHHTPHLTPPPPTEMPTPLMSSCATLMPASRASASRARSAGEAVKEPRVTWGGWGWGVGWGTKGIEKKQSRGRWAGSMREGIDGGDGEVAQQG